MWVQQEPVAGPLIFLIFIKDLNFSIWNSSAFHFADDTCLFIIKSTIKQIAKYVNKDLKSVSKWQNGYKMSLNVTKTEVTIFKSKAEFLTLT